ncbi:hypothetical protein HMPREF1094_03282 [[Clostridium] innocuum 2959]|uniref:Uncharacterized protein n=1 Tax=[Clostridium] innocuum 2959 TaxID=999413 RepID=N9V5A2_CLOIN|nr:hypothetical protein HMPREF1094_03282 [[Clostridium] innocuum 2959]
MAGACWTAPVRAESERGSEMDSFAYTRNYDNIALFDKHTRRFTFILGDGGIYSYDAIKKARKSLEYVGTPLENAFANIGRNRARKCLFIRFRKGAGTCKAVFHRWYFHIWVCI